MSKQKRYMDKVVLVKTTINPETEAEVLAALQKLIEKHGSTAQAVKHALLLAGK